MTAAPNPGRQPKPSPTKATGPINAEREEEIVELGRTLLIERGVDAFTMDELARRARCSKPTLYRRWPNKHMLIIQIVAARPAFGLGIDTGSLEGDLRELLGRVVAGVQLRGRLFLAIAHAMQDNPGLAEAWRAFGLSGAKGALQLLTDRAVARGELRVAPDLAILHSLLPGTFVWRRRVEGDEELASFAEDILQGVILPFFRTAQTNHRS